MSTLRAWVCLASVWLVAIGAGCAEIPGALVTPEPVIATPGQPDPGSQIHPSLIPTGEADPYLKLRLEMVQDTIERRGVSDARVLEAMRSVPRHLFVLEEYLDYAYHDNPLPIGYGQTISQPYIVALMTEMLELAPGEKVLEIGTGSGYQAAVLAALAEPLTGLEIFSVEIIPELAQSAAVRLEELGYTQVQVMQADGYFGWPEHAPFDAIIVTAAPDHLPAPLVGQLAEGGRLVIPIGPPGGFQTLWKFVYETGELKAYNLGGVSFVPFTGGGVAEATPAATTMP